MKKQTVKNVALITMVALSTVTGLVGLAFCNYAAILLMPIVVIAIAAATKKIVNIAKNKKLNLA